MSFFKIYNYFFYRIYKSIEFISVPRFWSDWKAFAVVVILEIFVFNSLDVLYHYHFNIPMKTIGNQRISYSAIGLVLFLVVINYYYFEYNDKWKGIIQSFDKLPKKKDELGGVIVWCIILFIVIFYWFYIIDLLSFITYE